MKHFYVLVFSSLLCLSSTQAADEGDILFHAVGSWNQDLEIFQARAELSYAFWNDFSLGPVMEYNEFFSAPGLGVTWHLEPFELLVHGGPLFWERDSVRRTAFHVSIHASYLMKITSHFEFLVSAGVNLPEKYFRGVPLGAGFRYWF